MNKNCRSACIYHHSLYRKYRPLTYNGWDEMVYSHSWTMWSDRTDAPQDRVLVCKEHQEYYMNLYTLKLPCW